ncbi:MAG: hypothetical protein AAF153_03005, partial [Pseudomonadota bacterium]
MSKTVTEILKKAYEAIDKYQPTPFEKILAGDYVDITVALRDTFEDALKAIKKHQPTDLENILAEGFDVNYYERNNITLLTCVALRGTFREFMVLYKHDVDLYQNDGFGFNFVGRCVQRIYDQYELLLAALPYIEKPNTPDKY